jgi:7-cyano-7-deazaguanine reductase
VSETRPALLGRSVHPGEYGRLDTFPADPAQTFVELSGDELTALCPGVDALQPDFYRWSIRYRPNDRCVESKSLKLYLLTFRDERVFAEHLAARIARDLAAVLDTVVTVRLVQGRRGGIETTAEAEAGHREPLPLEGPPQLNPASS